MKSADAATTAETPVKRPARKLHPRDKYLLDRITYLATNPSITHWFSANRVANRRLRTVGLIKHNGDPIFVNGPCLAVKNSQALIDVEFLGFTLRHDKNSMSHVLGERDSFAAGKNRA